MFIVFIPFMQSVFIFLFAFIACSTGYAQDVANSNYPAPADSHRIQTTANGSRASALPAINGSNTTGVNLVMTLPAKWARQPVIVEIFNEKGKLIRSISEKKASVFIIVSLEGIPLGAYEMRTSCGMESMSRVTIVAGHS